MRSGVERQQLSALLGDAKSTPQQGLGCGCAETNDYLRLYQVDLDLQPLMASRDLDRIRLLVNSTFAARLPLEMLDRVGHIGDTTIDAGLFQCFIQQSAGGANKGTSLQVLLVAGLLADEHNASARLAFAEDRLSAALPEIAGAAAVCGVASGIQGGVKSEPFGIRSRLRGSACHVLADAMEGEGSCPDIRADKLTIFVAPLVRAWLLKPLSDLCP